MMMQPHHSYEEWTRYVIGELSSADLLVFRNHVHACPACANDLADACCELAMMGVVVQQREVRAGARQRFMERIQVAGAGEDIDSPKKKSLLSMKPALARTSKRQANAGSRIDTSVRVASRVAAARIAGIF